MDWLTYKVKIKPYQLALFSAILFFGITVFISLESYNNLKERNSTLFNLRVEVAQKEIENRIIDYIQILKGVQGLINESDTVTRTEFKKFIYNLEVEKNYPGIHGIGYSVFVSGSDARTFEKEIKTDIIPDFEIWPKDKQSLYSSIVYLEPFNKRNQKALGYDMYSDTIRKEAMNKARDTGFAVLSSGLILVQEEAKNVQKGFNIYLPVYEDGLIPTTLEERRAKIKGFVYSPFRVNDLMNGILKSDFDDLNIAIIDVNLSKADTLYSKKIKRDSRSGLYKNLDLHQAGHKWNMHYAAAAGFGYDMDFPYYIFGGGFTISVLIFLILLSFGYIQKSTHLKQVITDNATAGLIILDKKGNCTFMNPSAEILTGYSFSEIENKTVMLFFKSEKALGTKSNRNGQLLEQLLGDSEIKNYEAVLFKKSGKRMHVSISSKRVNEHSSFNSILLEIRNIDYEKKSERALKERNKSLQTLNKIGTNLSAELDLKKLLQIITDSCTSLTKAEFGAFIYNDLNNKNESLLLFTISRVNPHHFKNFKTSKTIESFEPNFGVGGIIRSNDITKDHRFKDKKPYHGIPLDNLQVRSYLAVPVISRTGIVIGSLIFGHGKAEIFTKETEEIVIGVAAQAAVAIDNSQLFETISKKNVELLKINNDLDNFVYTASHDLKAPVLNIEGLVYALTKILHENNNEKVNLMIEMIRKSILKFKDTIQALTEVAKANKNIEDELELIDVKELLYDIKFSIKDLIESSNATIITDFEKNEIFFSKSNLRSIIINLITNAIKYRSDQDPKIKIALRGDRANSYLEVTDNGLGIPKEYFKKIFMMFKRVHSHVEGTGIGLYLVNRIVENEGGSVFLESEIGKGSTFSITLPLKVQKKEVSHVTNH